MNSKKVSEILDVSIDTLRYYEKIGAIPPVSRDKNGYRNYKTEDLNWIYLAKNLRSAGLSIEELVDFVSLAQVSDQIDVAPAQKEILRHSLETVEEKIQNLKQIKKLVTYKIESFDEHLSQFKKGNLSELYEDKLWEKDFKNK